VGAGALGVVLSGTFWMRWCGCCRGSRTTSGVPRRFASLLTASCSKAEIVEPSGEWMKRYAQGGRPVLGTLLAAKADYLITGDKDLLALRAEVSIITRRRFGSGTETRAESRRFADYSRNAHRRSFDYVWPKSRPNFTQDDSSIMMRTFDSPHLCRESKVR